MSTENGISIFSPTNRQFRNWTRGQGLMSTCFNAGSGVLRANGNTVFGSTDGALEFPPNIEMPKTGDSHMIFSDFRIFYQTVYPNDPNSPLTKDIDQIEKLNLKYMQNTFSIRVSSINYDYPSDILYTWQLEDSTMAGLLPVTKELSDLLMLLPAPIHCVYVPFPKRIINTCCRSGY